MNNFYPNYTTPSYQPMYQPRTGNQNGITWVQGIEGAKAFQLMPTSNVILMDSENDRFYIKTCDNVGMCNLRIFDYVETTNTQSKPVESVDLSNYVTRDELNEILNNRNGGKNNGKQFIQPTESNKPVINK